MKLGFIDHNIDHVTENFDPLYRAWNRCNMLIHSWIINLVSESIAQSIIFMEMLLMFGSISKNVSLKAIWYISLS